MENQRVVKVSAISIEVVAIDNKMSKAIDLYSAYMENKLQVLI